MAVAYSDETDLLVIKADVRKAAKTDQLPVSMGADLGREGQVQYDSPDPADPVLLVVCRFGKSHLLLAVYPEQFEHRPHSLAGFKIKPNPESTN